MAGTPLPPREAGSFNAELDKLVPISASVKTKLGRGGDDE